MAKLGYMLSTYNSLRIVSIIMIVIEFLILAFLICLFFLDFDEISKDSKIEKKINTWIKVITIIFIIQTIVFIYTPTVRIFKEITVEKALKSDEINMSEKEIRSFLNKIVPTIDEID